MNNVKGFTLVELIIVVAIIGVVGAIAMPSYSKYMLKAHRADDGKVHLAKIIDREERFYLQNNKYTSNFSALTGLNISSTSPDGFYEFEITLSNNDQAFSVEATAIGTQTRDIDCATMTINSVGQKSATAGTGGDPTKCW